MYWTFSQEDYRSKQPSCIKTLAFADGALNTESGKLGRHHATSKKQTGVKPLPTGPESTRYTTITSGLSFNAINLGGVGDQQTSVKHFSFNFPVALPAPWYPLQRSQNPLPANEIRGAPHGRAVVH